MPFWLEPPLQPSCFDFPTRPRLCFQLAMSCDDLLHFFHPPTGTWPSVCLASRRSEKRVGHPSCILPHPAGLRPERRPPGRREVGYMTNSCVQALAHTLAFPAPVSFGTHEETPQLGRRKKRDTRGHPSSHCDPSPSWFIIIVIRRDGDVSPSASMSILVRCRSRFLLVPLLSLWLW